MWMTRGVRRCVYHSCLRATSTHSSRRRAPDVLLPHLPTLPPPTHLSMRSMSRRHTTISDRTPRHTRRQPTFRHRNRLCHMQRTTLVRSNRLTPGYRAIICRRRSRPSYSPRRQRRRGPYARLLPPTFRLQRHPSRRPR